MSEIEASGYPIFLSHDIARHINKFLKAGKKRFSSLFILVDENTLRCCYPQLVAAIPALEDAEIIEVDSGEESKNIDVCTQIWSALSDYGADRKSLFINLGGGVISDLGGFIASTFKRGIPYINIPTTLLAQVDASIGGKTGIDLNQLKNEIGVFSVPEAVFVNPTFLNSLDQRQLLSGFAEVIKHALIADRSYWNEIRECDVHATGGFGNIIEKSILIKNKIVMEDPREDGLRKVLNFGHTIGHAFETFYLQDDNKKTLLHGEAIAAGMICEAYLSKICCKLSENELEEITGFILSKYRPLQLDSVDGHRLIELMQHDKKNEKGNIRFSLLSAIGKCEIDKTIKADQIIKSFEYYAAQIKLHL